MIVRMSRKYGETLILVTHDQEIAQYADRIIHLVDGNIVSDEPNRSLIPADSTPAAPRTETNVTIADESAQ